MADKNKGYQIMKTIPDFEDMLELLNRHKIKYLIIGGLAFIYHAKPRYTKDMDIWVSPEPVNIRNANKALAEFGSPTLLSHNEPDQVIQIGLAPNRIDLLVNTGTLKFDDAWDRRITGTYGGTAANWIDLDSLIEIKKNIDSPKHQDDFRVLLEVKKIQEEKTKSRKTIRSSSSAKAKKK